MRAYGTVVSGKLLIQNLETTETLGSFDPVDVVGLAKCFRAHNIKQLMVSSSVDFPHEYGMPEGVSVRDWMDRAWKRIAVKDASD